jgi:hypothetical protein
LGEVDMSMKIITAKSDVILFLLTPKGVLTDPQFNLDTDLDILLKKKLESSNDPYTTFNTMMMLDFDR